MLEIENILTIYINTANVLLIKIRQTLENIYYIYLSHVVKKTYIVLERKVSFVLKIDLVQKKIKYFA